MPFRSMIFVLFCIGGFFLLIYSPVSAASDDHDRLTGFTFIGDVEFPDDSEISRAVGRYEYQSGELAVRCEIVFPDFYSNEGYPTLVLCHGGINGVPSRMRMKAVELADDGYLVVMPSYRGEDGSDGEIEVACGEVDDVLACIDLLFKSEIVNTKRMAVIGSSHGALIAALAASRDPDIPVVVCAYGVMDIVGWWYYLNDAGLYEEDDLSRRIYGGGPLDHPEEFAIRSALRVASDIEPPLLIIQGATDTIVPPDQAEALVDAFINCGKMNYAYHIYPNVGHGFIWWNEGDLESRGETAMLAWEDILTFIHECWVAKEDEALQ